MTQRLYSQDAYTAQFEAQVTEALSTEEGRPAVRLAATYFYPTGGGQPHDLGRIGGARVLEVISEAAGTILHVLDQPLPLGIHPAALDWARRYDFMQQHSGQHLLSRAFELTLEAETVGFHLTANNLTIDLDRPNLTPSQLDEAETLANSIIYQNLLVRAWYPEADELARLPLRKISEKMTGPVRVVAMGDFDLCACAGTHVAATGEIGQIKILRAEAQKNKTRLEFVCGGRALADYRAKNRYLLETAARFSLSYPELGAALARAQEENKALSKALKEAKAELISAEARELYASAPTQPSGVRVVTQVWTGREMSDLSLCAQTLTQNPLTAVLLASAGEKAALLLAVSPDLGMDVSILLKEALARFGAKGGGKPTLAQGGGFQADEATLRALLAELRARF
jgi:alanyl-tRNA synthetase